MLQLFRAIQLSGDMEIGPGLDFNQQQENGYTDRIAITNNFLDLKPNQVTVCTRSISSILFYLSQNIEVPKKHVAGGLVTVTKTEDGNDFDWNTTPAGKIFKINSSDSEPENAYLAVPYRDHWFYIDDYDFLAGPTLTLPVR